MRFTVKEGIQLVGDLLIEGFAQLTFIPVGEHGGAVSRDDDDALAVGADLPGGVDEGFAEQKSGAGRGHYLMDERTVLVGELDEVLAGHIHLVAPGDNDGTAVIGAEIGLLTPPLGISCFVIKSTLNDPDISLSDIFTGALPFAVIMLLVLILLIAYPELSLMLI